jgi:4-hydroxy-tetrahydrodipicolinate synthase
MDRSSQGAIRAKAALQSAGLIPERAVRPPLLPATDDEVDLIETTLAAVRTAS